MRADSRGGVRMMLDTMPDNGCHNCKHKEKAKEYDPCYQCVYLDTDMWEEEE